MSAGATAFAFDLPSDKALAFFRAKGLKGSFAWQDMRAAEHDHDFTIAKMADMDLLADVRAAADQALAKGVSLQDFRQQLEPLLQQRGWWGKQEVTDPATGEVVLAQLGSPQRLALIYDVNLSTAYAAGRWASVVEHHDTFPYLMYDAVNDERTRAQHLAWDNTVLRWDDPWWQTHYPPNGWNCRCSTIKLTEADLAHMGRGGPDSAPAVKYRDWRNPRSGEVEQVPLGIDPGWDYHPGRAAVTHLAQTFTDKAGSLPASIGATAFRLLSTRLIDGLEQQLSGWVDAVLAAGLPAGRTAVVGCLGPEELAWLAVRGEAPETAGILIEDRLLVGRKAERHELAGNALSPDEWKQLPSVLAFPEQVLWDVRNQTLLYVFPAGDDTSGKLAVAVNYNLKKTGIVNLARTAFKIPSAHLSDGIETGAYEVVR